MVAKSTIYHLKLIQELQQKDSEYIRAELKEIKTHIKDQNGQVGKNTKFREKLNIYLGVVFVGITTASAILSFVAREIFLKWMG